MEKIIYANGTADVLVPAGQKIAIATYGNEYATLSFKRGNNLEFIQRLDNAQVTLGPWGDLRTVRIEAAQDQVSYDVATNPSIESDVRLKTNPLTWVNAISGMPIPTPRSGILLRAAIGDSITEQGVSAGSGFLRYNAAGYMSWLQALTMGRVWYPLAGTVSSSSALVNYCKGIGGNTTTQILARLDADILSLSPRPHMCDVLGGTNDLRLAPADTADMIFQRLKAIWTRLIEANIIPCVWTILPRDAAAGSWGGLTGAQIITQRRKLMQVNQLIRAYAAANPAVILCDPYSEMVDNTSAIGAPIASLFQDGLHPNDRGAFVMGKVGASATEAYLAKFQPNNQCGPYDAYNATENPFGNMIAGWFSASGGTAVAPATGPVPLGFSVGNQSGASASTHVFQARSDGLNGNELVSTVNSVQATDTTQYRFYPGAFAIAAPLANLAQGDAVYGEVEVDYTGTIVNGNPNLFVKNSDTSYQINALMPSANAAYADVPGTYKLLLRTPLIVQPATLLDHPMYVFSGTKAGGSETRVIRNPVFRKYNKGQPNSVLSA